MESTSIDRPRGSRRRSVARIVFHAGGYLRAGYKESLFRSACSAAPFLAALIGLAGCTSSAGRCIAGASLACACANGSTGAQTCGSDGTLGPCSCEGSDAGTNDDAGVIADASFDAGADAWSGTLNCGGVTCSSADYICRQNMCVMSTPDSGAPSCGDYQQGIVYRVTTNTCGFNASTFTITSLGPCSRLEANGRLHLSCTDGTTTDALVTYDGIGTFDCAGVMFTCTSVLTPDFMLSITCSYGAVGGPRTCDLGFN